MLAGSSPLARPTALPARAQTKPRRAVAIPNTKRLYYKRMLTGISGAAASLGIELHVEEYAYDVKKELLVVEALSQQGFDGYIVMSVGTAGAEAPTRRHPQDPSALRDGRLRILGRGHSAARLAERRRTLQAQLATKFAPAGSTLLYLTVQTDYGAEASEAFQVAVKQNQSAALVLTIGNFSREGDRQHIQGAGR